MEGVGLYGARGGGIYTHSSVARRSEGMIHLLLGRWEACSWSLGAVDDLTSGERGRG